MQIIRTFLSCTIFSALLLVSGVVSAQVKSAKGQASETYSMGLFTKEASAEVKQMAYKKAQLRAIEVYYAEAGEAESANLDMIRDKVRADPDKYILDTQILSEQDKVDAKTYTVTVRVNLNVAQLRNLVKGNSAISATSRANKSPLVFMFVARQVDSVKEYDARVFKKEEVTGKDTVAIGVNKSSAKTKDGSKKELNASAEAKSTATFESGGSTTRKASESTYKILPSGNINTAVTGVFSSSGFKVYQAALVEPASNGLLKVAAVEADYKSGNDLQSQTLQNMVAGVKAAQAQYLALATLDVGIPLIDDATGMYRVAVTVSARLMDVSGLIADELAVIGPVQYAAVGPTEEEARVASLKLAGEKAAREMVAQMNNTGVK